MNYETPHTKNVAEIEELLDTTELDGEIKDRIITLVWAAVFTAMEYTAANT
jgi:hypothetical protein